MAPPSSKTNAGLTPAFSRYATISGHELPSISSSPENERYKSLLGIYPFLSIISSASVTPQSVDLVSMENDKKPQKFV